VGVFSVREEAPGCNQDTQLLVQRFDESGAPALTDPSDLGCFSQIPIFAMAGNPAGDVLVLVAPSAGSFTGWEGYWLDRDLRVLQKFTAPELAAAPNTLGTSIATLLDGSFVIRFGGQWAYRIEPGATTLEEAPCFLTQRPDTDLQVTQDGNAYALVRGYAASCDESIEVFTPAGETCGPVGPLEGAGGKCEVALGRDGTISGSADALDAGAGQPRSCVLKFWPAALGKTEF